MSEQNQDVKVTLKGLFEATEVPSDKQEEFVSIFEAAVSVQAKEIAETQIAAAKETMVAEQDELKGKMEEYSEYLIAEYATKVDEYLDYTTEKLFEDNKLAITNGVKASLFDSLIEGMKDVFTKHGIHISEDKIDVVKDLEEAVAEKDAELNETKHEIISLKKQLSAVSKGIAITEATKDLAKTQQERVVELAKELGYDETFESKLATIVEAVAGSKEKAVTPAPEGDRTTFIAEQEEPTTPAKPSGRMAAYLKAVGAEPSVFG